IPHATVAAALQAGYRATADDADLAGFDVAVIAVPTPLADGAPDLAYVETASRSLAAVMRPGTLVVLESTTYPGPTTQRAHPILESPAFPAGKDFPLGYSPERIDPGNATWTFVNTPKVVSGIDETSRGLVEAFYGRLVDKVVPVGSTAEAELVKLL